MAPPRSLALVLVFVFALAGCHCGRLTGDDWPLQVRLEGDIEASPGSPFGPEDATGTLTVAPGIYGAAELFLSERGDWVLVEVDGESHWVRAPAPLSAAGLAFVRGLATEGRVHVRFFADGDRAIVSAEPGIMAVQLSSRRVRMLDHRAATLEACSMEAGREALRCSLDLDWDSAVFDADGRELSGNYEPAWR